MEELKLKSLHIYCVKRWKHFGIILYLTRVWKKRSDKEQPQEIN